MFQPTRPREILSREENWRATLKGWENVVDTERIRPILLVAEARAE
jgi:hypothetical protein